jgi:hypothetical protein
MLRLKVPWPSILEPVKIGRESLVVNWSCKFFDVDGTMSAGLLMKKVRKPGG